MADVSKLRLDNVTYDIKDDNARKYLVMVNEEPVSATKMVVETSDDQIELALQEDLDELSNIIYGRSDIIALIGDSYAEGYSHDGTNDGWAALFQNYYGDTVEFRIRYNGGAGFANSSNSFLSLLQTLPAENITKIVVCGGFNDLNYSQSDIETAISEFIESSKDRYPNSEIFIGFVGWIKAGSGSSAYSDWQTKRTALINNVLPAYQNCSKYGGIYLNNVEYWINDSTLTDTDGYHPSQSGNENIAKAAVNAVKSGSAPLPYNSSLRIL